MQMGKKHLVAEAVDYYQSGQIQIPYKLMELINELSEDERRSVLSLLNKNGEKRLKEDLKTLDTKPEKILNAGT